MMKKMFALLLAVSVVSFAPANDEVTTDVVAQEEEVVAVVVPAEMPETSEVAPSVVAVVTTEEPAEAAE